MEQPIEEPVPRSRPAEAAPVEEPLAPAAEAAPAAEPEEPAVAQPSRFGRSVEEPRVRRPAPDERYAEPRRAPRPAEPVPAASMAQHDPFAEWDTCRIKVHSRPIKSHFYAVPYEGGPVIARSPYFKVKRDGEQGVGPADALRALVADLTAAGWHQTGSGRVAWDLRFRRDVTAPGPVGRR